MAVDSKLIHDMTGVDLRKLRAITDKYLSNKTVAPTDFSRYIDPFVPEWYVGPEDISQREIADAYNFLARTGKLSKGMPLEEASRTPQMEIELYRRGLIAKEFAPAGRIEPYGSARAEIELLPRPGSEIERAASQIPRGLSKYPENVRRRILSGQPTSWEGTVTRDLAEQWQQKIGQLSEIDRRSLVARFKGYYQIPGRETVVSGVGTELSALMGREAEIAAEVQGGRLAYQNPLDLNRVTAKEIDASILSREIARQHLRTGAFVSEETLLRRGITKAEVATLPMVGGRARWLPGTAGEFDLFTRILPEGKEVPLTFQELNLGTTQQDIIETQAIRSAAARRKQVVMRERDGSVSAFYSSKPRAAALRRARGREAAKVQYAMMRRPPLAVPIGEPTGPAPVNLSAVRRMRSLAQARRAAVVPGVGRAATQVSTAITGINQAIKESALLPDIRRPELLIPGGKLRLDLRPFDLAEDLLEKYPGTTKGIEVRLGSKRLGMVPYRGAAGGRGGLINKVLGARQSAAYLEASGKFRKGIWARMTILPETMPGKIIPIRNVPVAGISFGEFGQLFQGQAEQMTQKAANRTAQLEGSELFKAWMAKIPTRWKIGAAAAGITIGAMMLMGREKANQPLVLEPGERPDASLYGGLRAGTISPEGMEEEDLRERMGSRMDTPRAPMSYSARIEDPNAIQTNIRIKTGTKRRTDFEAVGRAIGIMASDRSGADLGNVNVRVMDDSSRMNDQYLDRKIARLI